MACEAARARLDWAESARCDVEFETGIRAGEGFSGLEPYMMRAKLRLDIAFSGRAGAAATRSIASGVASPGGKATAFLWT